MGTAQQATGQSQAQRIRMTATVLKTLVRWGTVYFYRNRPVLTFVDGTVPYAAAWLFSFGGGSRALGTLSVVAWFYVLENALARAKGALQGMVNRRV